MLTSSGSHVDLEDGYATEKNAQDSHSFTEEHDVVRAGRTGKALQTERIEVESKDSDSPQNRAYSRPSVNYISSVPNGGWRAWLQVSATFFVYFNTWGIINSFGVFQTYYQTGALFKATSSDISWIGSLQGCLVLLVPTFSGPIYDAGYTRELIAVGSFLIILGQMMLSISNEYWQVFLSQGVCVGLGLGLIFIAGIAILSTYFNTRLATATGMAAVGSSTGGMVYPIIFDKLQPRIGFPWATRTLAFISLATLLFANLATKVRVSQTKRRKLWDGTAWKNKTYTLFNIGLFFSFMGMFTVYYYVQSYAIVKGIASPNLAFYLLTILNAASTFGRLIPNMIADRIGLLNVICPCVLVTSILCFCFITAHDIASVIVLVIFYGFFSGTLLGLAPTTYVFLSRDNRALIGTRMGMGMGFVSVGLVIGTPIAGAILKSGGYEYVWVFGGILTGLGGFTILLARYCHSGLDLRAKI